MEPAITTRRLSRRFDRLTAVDSIDLSIRRNEMFALIGPDGAGKTTTIRMLCGILAPTEGTAEVMGHDVVRDPEAVKKHIGYLSQKFSLYGDLSVDENIEFFARIHHVEDLKPRREELLGFTRLTPFRDRLASNLSGGMRQKLALACTLVHTPEILFLDEPTTGVDPVSRRDFWMILQNLLRDGMTILMTTPYLDEAERCTRVGLMNQGRLMDVGSPADLRKHVAGEVLEVVCSPVRIAREALRSFSGLEEIQAFGDRLNIIVAPGRHLSGRITKVLKSAGVDVAGVRTITPGMENIFISLVSRHDAQEAIQ